MPIVQLNAAEGNDLKAFMSGEKGTQLTMKLHLGLAFLLEYLCNACVILA